MSDQYSYSRVSSYLSCPYQYKCHYINGLRPIDDYAADNALIVGRAMHAAIEGDEDWAEAYTRAICFASDESETELLKIEIMSEKVRNWLLEKFESVEFEREIKTSDGFIGYVDCIAVDTIGRRWILDFKYSNSVYYLQSPQVHIYKNVVETTTGEKLDALAYVMIPKSIIRQKKTESVKQFRMRLIETCEASDIKIATVAYSAEAVSKFWADAKTMRSATKFPKNLNSLCDYCDYKKLCKEGMDQMLIPKNEKVPITPDALKKVYLYGAPFAGKTYLANQFPDALLINSDGNTKYVDSPRIHICDNVTMEGRIEKRKLAWEVFKDVIKELEQGAGSDYKTIVVDLLEDMYEYCRLYMYKELRITHESDDGFAAWDKVRTEFLSTIKRLVALPFNIVLISQEDCSRDITRRGGDKITSVMPALNEKVARKISGMVDIVLRVVNIDGERVLQNRPSDVIFGGGRLQLDNKDYPCTIESINNMYTASAVKE